MNFHLINSLFTMKNKTSYNQQQIPESELILNEDGSVYHLHLKNKHIADNVIVVGDPGRVAIISAKFDSIEYKIGSREFITHTGFFNGVRLTVVSTGIGVDNIDIVVNELDAAVNIDLETRTPKKETRSLNIIRIGTSGAMQENIPVGSFVASIYAFGFDGVPSFYTPEMSENEMNIQEAFIDKMEWKNYMAKPYFTEASNSLVEKITQGMFLGITATANGFYGPQGRMLRLKLNHPNMEEQFRNFTFNKLQVTNFEMECSGLYALCSMLGHNSLTVCTILANRYRKEFSKNAKSSINELIDIVLSRLTS